MTENEQALQKHRHDFPDHEVVVSTWDDDTHWFCNNCPAQSEEREHE